MSEISNTSSPESRTPSDMVPSGQSEVVDTPAMPSYNGVGTLTSLGMLGGNANDAAASSWFRPEL